MAWMDAQSADGLFTSAITMAEILHGIRGYWVSFEPNAQQRLHREQARSHRFCECPHMVCDHH